MTPADTFAALHKGSLAYRHGTWYRNGTIMPCGIHSLLRAHTGDCNHANTLATERQLQRLLGPRAGKIWDLPDAACAFSQHQRAMCAHPRLVPDLALSERDGDRFILRTRDGELGTVCAETGAVEVVA